jgi:hypothetical protein
MDTVDAPTDPLLELRLFGAVDATTIDTPRLIAAMLDTGKGISDLVFSPGRAPQVERHGELMAVAQTGLDLLEPKDTARIARDLIGGNAQVLGALDREGASDFSYSL